MFDFSYLLTWKCDFQIKAFRLERSRRREKMLLKWKPTKSKREKLFSRISDKHFMVFKSNADQLATVVKYNTKILFFRDVKVN